MCKSLYIREGGCVKEFTLHIGCPGFVRNIPETTHESARCRFLVTCFFAEWWFLGKDFRVLPEILLDPFGAFVNRP